MVGIKDYYKTAIELEKARRWFSEGDDVSAFEKIDGIFGAQFRDGKNPAPSEAISLADLCSFYKVDLEVFIKWKNGK